MTPFPNHEAYLATNPTKEHFYKWDKFSLYNDHLATIVDKRRRERLQHLTLHDSSPQTELLDIFFMTVLRPDGESYFLHCYLIDLFKSTIFSI